MKNNRGNILVAFFFMFFLLFGGIAFYIVLTPMSPPAPSPLPSSSQRVEQVSSSIAVQWPPQLHQTYPNLALVNQNGQVVQLDSFQGKVLLIEPVGMTCPACQSFSGAQKLGGYQGLSHQRDLQSIEEYLLLYGNGALLSDVVFIQILLYNLQMQAPSVEEAQQWAKHFQLDVDKNQIVLAGIPELLGQKSYNMIPGFQLVDKNFILRSDSTGHQPQDNLYTKLLPMIPDLLKEEVKAVSSKKITASPERIAAAYKLVPGSRHPQTLFQAKGSTSNRKESAYLEKLFQLTDQALVQRIETLAWFQNQGQTQNRFDEYNTETIAILQQLRQLNAPTSKLKEVHTLITQAIQEQFSFFTQWNESLQKNENFPYRVFQGDPIHPLVNQSHQKLYQAYLILIKIFPKESAHNKQAFFSHLCHLDFI